MPERWSTKHVLGSHGQIPWRDLAFFSAYLVHSSLTFVRGWAYEHHFTFDQKYKYSWFDSQ